MIHNYVLRRHKHGDLDSYWYEVICKFRENPAMPTQERHIAVVSSEPTGRIFCDELNKQYRAGLTEGIRRFAWWKDGEQFVGICGTRLKQAMEDVEKEIPWI